MQPAELLCQFCEKNSIPSPEGATSQTRFTCKVCTSRFWCRKLRAGERRVRRFFTERAVEPIERLRYGRDVQTAVSADAASTLPSVVEEASALAELVRRGQATVEEIRELIAVPEHVAVLLERFAAISGTHGGPLIRVVRWRAKVGARFEQMLFERSVEAPGTPPAA